MVVKLKSAIWESVISSGICIPGIAESIRAIAKSNWNRHSMIANRPDTPISDTPVSRFPIDSRFPDRFQIAGSQIAVQITDSQIADFRLTRLLQPVLLGATLVLAACGGDGTPAPPTTPTPPPAATPSIAAPQATAPRGGQILTDSGATLTVTHATVTGTVTNVRYRFEWSELDTFPADSRTGSTQDVAPGKGSTSYTITDTL